MQHFLICGSTRYGAMPHWSSRGYTRVVISSGEPNWGQKLVIGLRTDLNSNALMGLIYEEEMARVVATEERNVNISKVTMEHCFKAEGKQEITKK